MRSLCKLVLIAATGFAALAADDRSGKSDPAEGWTRKAESIVLPRIELREASLTQAIALLRVQSVTCDPERKGVPIDLRLSTTLPVPASGDAAPRIPGLPIASAAPARPIDRSSERITVSLTNIPLSEALRYVSNLAGFKVRTTSSGILLVSIDEPEPLIDRTIKLPPEIFGHCDFPEDYLRDEAAINAARLDLTGYLTSQNVSFGPGASARLSNDGLQIFAHQTEGQIDMIESVIVALAQERPLIPGPTDPKLWDSNEGPSAICAALRRRAEHLVLEKVWIVGLTLPQALKKVNLLGVRTDRDAENSGNRGVNVVSQLDSRPQEFSPTKVTPKTKLLRGATLDPLPDTHTVSSKLDYRARRVTLMTVVEELALRAGGEVRVQPYAISIVNRNSPKEMITREYLIPPVWNPSTLKQDAPPPELTPNDSPVTHEDFLTRSRMPSGPEASAIYIPSSNKLIVHDTEERLAETEARVTDSWNQYYASDAWRKQDAWQQRRKQRTAARLK